MSAKFLRHEGYLGAVGAYLKVHPMPAPPASGSEDEQGKVNLLELALTLFVDLSTFSMDSGSGMLATLEGLCHH